MKKRLLSILLAAMMVLTMLPLGLVETAWAADVVDSGSCGWDMRWRLSDDGTLTISGTGEMNDYDDETENYAPWHDISTSSRIKSVIIEDGVTSIGRYAFSYCGALTSVTIPSSVTSIGNRAFRSCIKLKDIWYGGYGIDWLDMVESSDTEIDNDVNIHYKDDLYGEGSCGKNVNWVMTSDGILTISGTGAMTDYYPWENNNAPWYSASWQVKQVIIRNGVTSIGARAFLRCTDVTSVTIPNSVTSIGIDAFNACTSLASVTIPNSVTRVESGAFDGCTSLTSVTIPDGVTEISMDLFFGCTGLKSVTIPSSVTSIENYAFRGCTNLTSMTIPDSVTSIGWNAFMDCVSLTDIKLPTVLKIIEDDTFSKCASLTSITIPSGVTSIGENAFYFCYNLTDVYYAGTASDWAKITIEEGNEDLTSATLHCAKSAPAAPVVKIGNSASSGKPMLTWNAVEGATSYRIYRSTSNGSGYSLLGTTTATSYTNTGAKAGTTYYYRVKACNDAGLSPYSNIVSGQSKAVTPKPSAPVVKIGHSAASGKPMLTWNAVSGATSYKVYRATSQNGTYSLLGTVTATSYTNTGAKAGVTYYYKVKAVNSAGESAYSNIVSGRATVTTLTMGHSSTSGKPQLTWKAVSGAASYKVYRATAKNGAYTVINATKALTYTNVGAALGTTYYYKVEALNASGKSMGFSAAVEGKVAPVLAVGYSSVSGKPQLTWKAVPGATEYQVYRSTQQNSGYTKINTTTATSYVNTGAKAGTTYYYRIVAVKGTAVSDFSNIVSARPSK